MTIITPPKRLLSSILPYYHHHTQQTRSIITRVRLKWVKNRSLDHVIDTQTDLKAACLLKDAIVRSSTGFLTSKILNDAQKFLGLTVPTLRFVRRYPTLFEEYPHPKYPSLPCFKLTQIAQILHKQEMKVVDEFQSDFVDRLSKLLMMTTSKMLPLQSLHPLKWDFGLPDDLEKNLVKKHPDHFRIVKGTNGLSCVKLLQWREELAVSELQKKNERSEQDGIDGGGPMYRDFKRGKSALEFPMSFPRGYGGQKKVQIWMDEFQKLPYISPYEDARVIDPNSDLMEKRVVGVLHEFLSLSIYKKTKRNYLRSLREELILPHKFTRMFTRYPGIFYLSFKCKATSVALREGYRRGKLINPHPLARYREKFHHVMRTGLVYRNSGIDMLTQMDSFDDNVDNTGEEEGESEDEEYEMVEEGETSDGSSDSDDD